MGERIEVFLREGRVVVGRVEVFLEDEVFLGGEDMRILDIEVFEVFLGVFSRDGVVEVLMGVLVVVVFL